MGTVVANGGFSSSNSNNNMGSCGIRTQQRQRQSWSLSAKSSSSLAYAESNSASENDAFAMQFDSPVLKQVYRDMIEYKSEFGHPNIPLGSPEGRLCKTLRRLHIQNKLSDSDVAWLDGMGFTFHSLEEVYYDVDFEELLQRLLKYEVLHPNNNFQIPKKCKEDPELGAWVTGIRRLGKDGVAPEHARRLDEVNFAWISTRKCGSKFMKKYREILSRIEAADGDVASVIANGDDNDDDETGVKSWLQAQQTTFRRGGLSPARAYYLEQMLEPILEEGKEWQDLEL